MTRSRLPGPERLTRRTTVSGPTRLRLPERTGRTAESRRPGRWLSGTTAESGTGPTGLRLSERTTDLLPSGSIAGSTSGLRLTRRTRLRGRPAEEPTGPGPTTESRRRSGRRGIPRDAPVLRTSTGSVVGPPVPILTGLLRWRKSAGFGHSRSQIANSALRHYRGM